MGKKFLRENRELGVNVQCLKVESLKVQEFKFCE